MIKIFNDDGRLIIVVENDDGINMEKLTKDIISLAVQSNVKENSKEAISENKQQVQQENIKGLLPVEKEIVKETVEEITTTAKEVPLTETAQKETVEMTADPTKFTVGIMIGDKYVGMTPKEAVTSGKTVVERDKIVVDLYCNYGKIKAVPIKKAMLVEIKDYITSRFENVTVETAKRTENNIIKIFFEVYKPIILNEIKNILEQSGFATIEDFLENSSDLNLKGAYYSTVTSLLKRVKA